MRNARRSDERITIGLVPDSDDLEQLRSIGYRTLVDVRDEDEKLGGSAQRKLILDVLNGTRWNRRKTARLLGVSYNTLLAKMSQYGLEDG
jgi:DNA-binding NtrC family response regulator